MASETLNGRKVAILVTDGFEQVEMTKPRQALDQAGVNTRFVSPKDGQVDDEKNLFDQLKVKEFASELKRRNAGGTPLGEESATGSGNAAGIPKGVGAGGGVA